MKRLLMVSLIMCLSFFAQAETVVEEWKCYRPFFSHKHIPPLFTLHSEIEKGSRSGRGKIVLLGYSQDTEFYVVGVERRWSTPDTIYYMDPSGILTHLGMSNHVLDSARVRLYHCKM